MKLVNASKIDFKYIIYSRKKVLYGRNDKKPNIVVQKKTIKDLKRNESYKYLGKLIKINCDDPK